MIVQQRVVLVGSPPRQSSPMKEWRLFWFGLVPLLL